MYKRMSALAVAIENSSTSCPNPPMAFAIEDGRYPSRRAMEKNYMSLVVQQMVRKDDSTTMT
jgi:hypothetical protein